MTSSALPPHRFPFLLIDRVVDLERRKRIVAIKNVTINEPFFAGHFPGLPVMPGVLIVEAMAQAGGVLLFTEVEDRDSNPVLFTGTEQARFRRPSGSRRSTSHRGRGEGLAWQCWPHGRKRLRRGYARRRGSGDLQDGRSGAR